MTESQTYESKPQPETLLAAMAKHGITVTAEFVPWSQSRNKGEKSPSLNWRVTLNRNSMPGAEPLPRPILTTDYSAGMGHCPSYKQGRLSVDTDAAIRSECETGRSFKREFDRVYKTAGGTKLEPKPADVMHSLILDSDVIDHPTYESWASDFGYDEDSRKGEAIYRACLEIALKLRAGLGESVLAELRDAAQDY